MKNKFFKLLSLLSLIAAAGEISGVSQMGAYQADENEKIKRIRKF